MQALRLKLGKKDLPGTGDHALIFFKLFRRWERTGGNGAL